MIASFSKQDRYSVINFHDINKGEISAIFPKMEWMLLENCESATFVIAGIELKFFT